MVSFLLVSSFSLFTSFCSQLGFIDFLVAPLYDVWTLFSSTPFTETCIKNISLNRDLWKEWQESPHLMPPFTSKSPRKDEILDMKTMSIVKFGQVEKSISTASLTRFWSMIPHGTEVPGNLPSRLYGTGIKTYHTTDRRSSSSLVATDLGKTSALQNKSNAASPDLVVTRRSSFRNVVQTLIATKGIGTLYFYNSYSYFSFYLGNDEKPNPRRPRASSDSGRPSNNGKQSESVLRPLAILDEKITRSS